MKNNNSHNIKSPGFKTPEGYFESLDKSILSRLQGNDFLKVGNSSGFTAPDNYFETFNDKVLNAVNSNERKVIPLIKWHKVAYISGIAASLILAFNLLFTNSDKLSFDDLETASMEKYLMNEDLNSYDIAPYLEANEMNSDDFVENTLNASDIEDYLLLNSDVEHLITE